MDGSGMCKLQHRLMQNSTPFLQFNWCWWHFQNVEKGMYTPNRHDLPCKTILKTFEKLFFFMIYFYYFTKEKNEFKPVLALSQVLPCCSSESFSTRLLFIYNKKLPQIINIFTNLPFYTIFITKIAGANMEDHL